MEKRAHSGSAERKQRKEKEAIHSPSISTFCTRNARWCSSQQRCQYYNSPAVWFTGDLSSDQTDRVWLHRNVWKHCGLHLHCPRTVSDTNCKREQLFSQVARIKHELRTKMTETPEQFVARGHGGRTPPRVGLWWTYPGLFLEEGQEEAGGLGE